MSIVLSVGEHRYLVPHAERVVIVSSWTRVEGLEEPAVGVLAVDGAVVLALCPGSLTRPPTFGVLVSSGGETVCLVGDEVHTTSERAPTDEVNVDALYAEVEDKLFRRRSAQRLRE